MKDKKFGYNRTLNKPGFESTAAVAWSYERNKRYPFASFDISDCTRAISLTFSVKSKKEYKNALYKIDTLIAALEAFRERLIKERKRLEDKK